MTKSIIGIIFIVIGSLLTEIQPLGSWQEFLGIFLFMQAGSLALESSEKLS